jgi:hypothetical protein
MKALTFTFIMLFIGLAGFSQNTYYWVGGTGTSTAPASFTATSNWNTRIDGSGDSRSIAGAQSNDELIFDGSNIGGSAATTGPVYVTMTNNTIGRLALQNNTSLFMQRLTGTTGTLSIQAGSDATPFYIDPASTLTISTSLAEGTVVIALLANVTGLVEGTFTMSNTGGHRITSQVTNGLVFASGSTFNSGATPTASTYPFGSASQAVQDGVVFKSGSNLILTGNRSPFANTSTFSSCNMEPGSNFYVRTSNVSGTGSYSNLKTLGNIFIQNGATFTADGPFYKIDNLTIDNGCTFVTHSSGNTPILGNLVVNGTLSSPAGSSNIIVMGGNNPQTISGTGTIKVASLTVANYSDVTLTKSIDVAAICNIVGKLNFGTASQLTGSATFTSRVNGSSADFTGNTVAGSYQITGVTTTISSVTGLKVSGAGLNANTNAVGFSASNNTINLSKPAMATTTGTTFTFTSDSATLITANTNGLDSTAGSVIVTGTKAFQAGTSYVINAATLSPFGISTAAGSNMTLGNVVLNASVTTNYDIRVLGNLTLASGNLTIRPIDTLRLVSGNAIIGAPFGNSKYIITGISAGNVGVLRMDGIDKATLFPVGTSSEYLPVSLTPSSAMDYAVSVFKGATVDGTPLGTPMSPTQKAAVVDAVWTINRANGSGDCMVNLNWKDNLEGSLFNSYTNDQIGISRHNGSDWESPIGSGDNAANTATAQFANFSPFIVAKTGAALPVQLKNISASLKSAGVEITWNVANEESILSYVVERSTNGTDFSEIGSVYAAKRNTYSFIDASKLTGVIFYRLKIVALNGNVKYSGIVTVKQTTSSEVSIYPNPVVNSLNVSGLNTSSQLKIVNSTGAVIMEQKVDANSINWNISNLKPGYYILQILADGKMVNFKPFVKK